MKRPIIIILGVAVVSLAALIFLSRSFDPFTASQGIKTLFLIGTFIVIVSLSTLVLYGIAVMWHEGMHYFLARYFGLDFPYFKSAFRRAFMLGLLMLVLFSLKRSGSFTRPAVSGAVAGLFVLELLSSLHERHTSVKS